MNKLSTNYHAIHSPAVVLEGVVLYHSNNKEQDQKRRKRPDKRVIWSHCLAPCYKVTYTTGSRLGVTCQVGYSRGSGPKQAQPFIGRAKRASWS